MTCDEPAPVDWADRLDRAPARPPGERAAEEPRRNEIDRRVGEDRAGDRSDGAGQTRGAPGRTAGGHEGGIDGAVVWFR